MVPLLAPHSLRFPSFSPHKKYEVICLDLETYHRMSATETMCHKQQVYDRVILSAAADTVHTGTLSALEKVVHSLATQPVLSVHDIITICH